MSTVPSMSGRSRFLAAAHRQRVDTTPVWFMRQAGRCLPEYRTLREHHTFMEVATTPELAARATLMPVDRWGVDGAVLFADIMLPFTGLGIPFEIRSSVGPIIADPIRTAAQVSALHVVEAEEGTPYVLEAVRILRRELGDRSALLGFSGAPFTLACYAIEGKGSREYPKAKALMYGEPKVWHALMEKLTETVIGYLRGQIEAGADTVQLFDSWLGVLSREAYTEFALPYTRRIFAEISPLAPTIHFSTGTAHLLPEIGASGCAMVSVDWRLPIDEAWGQLPHDVGIQGNLDPSLVVAGWDAASRGVDEILARVGDRRGHIFNLGHGIIPESDPDVLGRIVEHVHSKAK